MKTGNGGIYHIPQDLKRPEKALGNGLSGLFLSTVESGRASGWEGVCL